MAAEAVLGAAVKVLLQNLVSISGEQINIVRYFKKDLEKLKGSVSMIQSFLNDAEKKQVTDETVKLWLKKLENVAYDADNVLDELHYQHKKIQTQHKIKKKVRGFVPYAIRHPKIARRIKKINKNLEEINHEASNYGLQKAVVGAYAHGSSASLETDSFSNDPIFLGRKNDVSEIVKKMTIIPNDQVLSILPIVGMGGVGKSTVAREVFDHETIKNHFAKRFWVHVSEKFDVVILLKKILTSLTETNIELGNKQALLEKLQKYLGTGKFLLVLDDVWNDSREKWDDFINPLRRISYGIGNGIIVTTRLENVASLVRTLPIQRLNNLSDDECWSIIKAKAVEDNIPSEFEAIGVSISKRCQGLPLAARVVGGLLHGKSIDEWRSIEKNWLSDIEDKNSIFKILKLSFDHLSSPSLKKCFAYCSIFPKGFNLERERLVELWMAEGFLGGNDDMEIVGNKFFNQLLENSLLLQVARRNDCYNMHDLVHDLASSILHSSDQVRYIGLQSVSGESCDDIPDEQASCLRSLLFNDEICVLMFSKFKSLHVLILVGNFDEELPSSIRELIHLRCLDVSGTMIEYLPDSIGELYHLQTLRVRDVWKKLPNTMKRLMSLRHLHIPPSIELPPEMGRLTSLRTLPYFGVGDEKGRGIGELGSLKNLQGELKIYNLQKVHDKEEAKSADLFRKPNIVELTLQWSFGNRGDESVLEGLQPHSNLKSLNIYGFGGRSLPSWCSKMSGLNNLMEIRLEDCTQCEQLPTLGHLPHLKNLYLINLRNVKSIGSSFYGIDMSIRSNNTITVFPALQRLELVEMWKLKEWLEAELMPNATENRRRSQVLLVFPRLEFLMVKGCMQLMSAPSHFPCLKELVIYKMHTGLPLASICGIKLFSLKILRIDLITGLVCLPDWLFRNNKNLTELWISCCSNLRELPYDLHTLGALEILSIDDSPNLKTIAYPHESHNEKLLGLSCLRQLSIINCRGLVNLASETIESCATSIEKLELRGLTSLRVNMGMMIGILQKMSRISVLEIPGIKMKITAESLRILTLDGEGHSGHLPDQLQHLTDVSNLRLNDFGEMEELPEWFGDNNNLSSSLEALSLYGCTKMCRLPSKEAMLRLTMLSIERCPLLNLERRRDGEEDDNSEWPKISHIPEVYVDWRRIPTYAAQTQRERDHGKTGKRTRRNRYIPENRMRERGGNA